MVRILPITAAVAARARLSVAAVALLALFNLLIASVQAVRAANTDWILLREDARTVYRLDRVPVASLSPFRTLVRVRREFKVQDERAYALDLVEIDCSASRYRFQNVTIYDHDGDLVHRYRLDEQMVAIPAGSFLDDLHRQICSTTP